VRLNRFLAAAGLGSRRHCDELIAAGRVTINGRVCTDFSAQPAKTDHVKVNGKMVRGERRLDIILHKPAGFVSTRSDPNARDTIFDLLPPHLPRLFNIGRLDTQTEGLLVLTNDGDLAQRLTHPRYKIEKEYEVTLDRPWDPALAPKLISGLMLDGQRARMEKVYPIKPTRVRVILRQGINRQIRRMFYELGYEVKKLVRTRVGRLRLGDLPRGHWRPLIQSELKSLQSREITPLPRAKSPAAARSPHHDSRSIRSRRSAN
jgi:23S rRNA pseudouridine2605 synthase